MEHPPRTPKPPIVELDQNQFKQHVHLKEKRVFNSHRVYLLLDGEGGLNISSTMNQKNTLEALDKAMEAIDGNRLPPK